MEHRQQPSGCNQLRSQSFLQCRGDSTTVWHLGRLSIIKAPNFFGRFHAWLLQTSSDRDIFLHIFGLICTQRDCDLLPLGCEGEDLDHVISSSPSTSATLVRLFCAGCIFIGCVASLLSCRSTFWLSGLETLKKILTVRGNNFFLQAARTFHASFLSFELKVCSHMQLKTNWLGGIAEVRLWDMEVSRVSMNAPVSSVFSCSKMTLMPSRRLRA